MSKKINETASGGSVGAASVAVNMSRMGDSPRQRLRTTEYVYSNNIKREKEREEARKSEENRYKLMREKLAKLKKRKGLKEFLKRSIFKEAVDLNDVISKLRGAQRTAAGYDDDVVSYGVEDDNGNIMRITIRSKQAKDFEYILARELEKYKENRLNGSFVDDKSLAEILFDLKNKFEIVDVKFPIIPTDVVYNADQATKVPKNSLDKSFDDDETLETGGEGQRNFEKDLDKEENADQIPDETENSEDDLNDKESEELNDNNGDNNDLAKDFNEPENNETSLLKDIINMLKSQSDAAKATAEAEAEKARAKQAEYTAMGVQSSLEREEKMAKVKAQIEEQKEKEKRAKEIAELARFNVQKTNGSFNFKESLIYELINEFDNNQDIDYEDYIDTTKIQNMEKDLRKKYARNPQDDPSTISYKQQQLELSLKELNSRKQRASLKKRYDDNAAKTLGNFDKNQRNIKLNSFNQNMAPNNNGIQKPA